MPAGGITAEAMAALHHACFTVPRPWRAVEFSLLRANPLCFTVGDLAGFALGRVVADEAEMLTLAVDPMLRRQGIGADLMGQFLAKAKERAAQSVFLEVIDDNEAARALYLKTGFTVQGLRRGYYHFPNGMRRDAVVMRCAL